MKAVIIAGGKPPSYELLMEELKTSTIIICADSGADCVFKYGIIPTYLIGDFDSINKETFKYFSESRCIIEKFPKYKDYTDTELALLRAKELYVDSVVFLGCTGSRLDHTFANMGLLLKCFEYKIKGYIKDDNNCIELLSESVSICGKENETFSLLAYNSTIKGLSITGAKYPLVSYELKVGNSLTVSNEFKNYPVNIEFTNGILLLFRSID